MDKVLIIQTAFIGDVVLATGLVETLHENFPEAEIDFLLRKGNESLLADHPYIHEVLIWDKKKNKQRNLAKTLFLIRSRHYDKVINVQRFAATGLLTAFSGASQTIGFDKNPFSSLFTTRITHQVTEGPDYQHEIQRNAQLIKDFTDGIIRRPRLYPSTNDETRVQSYKQKPFITVSPASVWFTKQYPKEKWMDLIGKLPSSYNIYLLGAPSDTQMCQDIVNGSKHTSVTNLSGQLSFLQSAALMKDAVMNFVNDSAPMHFASAMNAPVTAVYCSTIPAFGFGPLSDRSFIVEVKEKLDCRPCGLHGHNACPKGHFKCAYRIQDDQLLQTLRSPDPAPQPA